MDSSRERTIATLLLLTVLALVALSAGMGVAAADEDLVTLTVTVEDQDGNPISGADITATWEDGETTATTASNGRAFVDVPAGADVEIDAEHDDFVRNSPYLVEDASERDVTVGVVRKGSIAFRVTDDGDPVADAEVVVRKDGQRIVTGTTDDDGAFDSGAVERGQYTARVTKPRYFRESFAVTVDDDVERQVELQRGSVTLSVTVRDGHLAENPPVEAALVEVGDIASVRTLGEGEATARVPVNTRLTVTAGKDGYVEESETVRIPESDQNVTLNISREQSLTLTTSNERIVVGERLTVTVVDAYGAGVEGATVRRGEMEVGETSAEGTLTFRLDEAGTHDLVAVRDGVESQTVSVRVVGDGTDTQTETPTPTETDTPTESTTEDEGVGFGVVLAAVAIVAGSLLLTRRD